MLSRVSILVVFSLISLSCSAESLKKRYDGFQLLQIPLTSASERQFIRDVSDSDDLQLDFWSEGMDVVDVLVSPQSLQSFIDQLNLHHIKYTVQSSDIQVDIDNEERILRETKREKGRALDYDTFNLYEDIMVELDALVLRCPAGLTCETVVHGVSYEGRDIKGIRVRKSGSETRKVWLDATIHAREWLATAVSLKIISNIVDNYSSDSALASVVDQYDWYLLPIVNVDGYAFTWTGDRLWRKNRSPNSGAVCLGTDLNRNFEYVWGTSGSSDNPCSSTYHGDSPASELETQAMQARLVEFGSSLVMTINLHTYGRMWLSPWSYETSVGTCYVGPDDQEVFRVANAAANAVEETHNTVWTRGPFCTVLYPGSGTSVDFGKGVGGVKYTFLPELRGNNFIIAATEIQPAFEETWNGVLAALTAIDNSQDYYMD